MRKFLNIRYIDGITRFDIVIDRKDLNIYKKRIKKGEISIIEISPFN